MTKFVKLDESLLSGDVWGFLKPGPRCLYIELKREFNGSNNGKIFLSHREAAYRLGTHRNTVGPWFLAHITALSCERVTVDPLASCFGLLQHQPRAVLISPRPRVFHLYVG